MTQRRAIAFGVGAPVLFIAALLIWGVARNGGQAGSPGINQDYGEVPLSVAPDADFQLTTLDGKTIKLSDLKGKVVMVDFWSSWCAPCKSEGPDLAATYREWRDRGVEFVGIAIWDDKAPVESFIKANGIEYMNGIDPNGSIAVDWGVKGIPEKFFVTADGRIVKKIIGPNTKDSLDSVLTDLTDQALGIQTTMSN